MGKGDIKNGDTARDLVTGFEGVVVGETNWLYGCRRLVIQPQQLHEGKPIDPISFDEESCVLVEKFEKGELPRKQVATGGPADTPQQQATPARR